MKNYSGSAANEKIGELFSKMNEGSLILSPSFQRNLVWNNSHKENFIETILKKLPFPEVYFCDGETNLETKKPQSIVVDGQQRLGTIREYLSGELKVKKISSYEDLSPKDQGDFLKYKVVVRDLGDVDNNSIKDIFKRINSVGYALNAMEIKNALYEGKYISLAQAIAKNKELENMPVFGDAQVSRMRDVEFLLQIMTGMSKK